MGYKPLFSQPIVKEKIEVKKTTGYQPLFSKPKIPTLSAKDQRTEQVKSLLGDIAKQNTPKIDWSQYMSKETPVALQAIKASANIPVPVSKKFQLPAPYKNTENFLNSEKTVIKDKEKEYSVKTEELKTLGNKLDTLKKANKINEFNYNARVYNSKLKELQAFEDGYKNIIDNYNLGIKEVNDKNLSPAEYNLKKNTGGGIPMTKRLESLYDFSKKSEKILTPFSSPVTNWLNKRLPLKGETPQDTLKRGMIENAKDWAKLATFIPKTVFNIGAQAGAYLATVPKELITGKPSKPIEIPKYLQPIMGKELKGVGRDYVDNLNTGMPAWAAFTLSASKAVLNVASLGGMIENLLSLHKIETLQKGKLILKENENIIGNLGLKETAQQPVYIQSPNNPDIYAKITPNSIDIIRPDEVRLIPDNLKLNISSYDIAVLKKQPSLYDKLNNFLNGNTSVIGERINLGDISGLPAVIPTGAEAGASPAVLPVLPATAGGAVATIAPQATQAPLSPVAPEMLIKPSLDKIEKVKTPLIPRKKSVITKKINLTQDLSTPQNLLKAETESNIIAELETSQKGERLFISDYENTIGGGYAAIKGIPSTFPKWIPQELRQSDIVNAVAEHLKSDTIPTKVNEIRLYNIIAEKIDSVNEVIKNVNDEIDIDSIDFVNNTINKTAKELYDAEQKERGLSPLKTSISPNVEKTSIGQKDIFGKDQKVEAEKAQGSLNLSPDKTALLQKTKPILSSDEYKAQKTTELLAKQKGQGDILATEKIDEKISEPIPLKEQDKLIKRSEVIKNLSEKLNVPIKRGHFRKPKSAGIYKIKPDIIRVKQGGVGTVSHEVGHFLDDNFQDLHTLISKTYKNELAPLDYDISKQRSNEGFSEYLRYYITQPNIVESKAPNFHNAFTEWLNKNEDIKNIIESARDDYKKWQEMPSVMKVKSQISFEEDKGRINVKDIETKLKTWIFDDLAPLENYVKLAKKQGISITDEENPYLLARLYRGWVGKANHFLENGTFDTKLNINGKGLKEILEPVKNNLDDLSTYLISKRVPELSKRGIKTGINTGDAKQAIIDLEKLHPEFKEVSDEIYKYQDRIMNYALESGLIDAKTFVKIREINQNYVPFFRVMEELGNKGFFGKKFANLTSPTKRIKGSERDIVNPLESIVKNTYTIISAADRNITARMIADLSNKDKELGRLVEKIPPPMAKVASVNIAEEIQKITGIDVEDTRTIIDIFRPSFLNGKENILTVLNGGKKEYYQVEQSLYNTMLGLDQKELGVAMKLLSYPAQWLRAGATTLSPEFLARNPVRDQWSAFLYSKSGYLSGYDLARGLFSLLKRDDLYWEWVRSGGMQSMLVSMDRDYMKKNLKELFGKSWKESLNPLKWFQVISEFGEQATRLGEFKKMRTKGASIQTSGFASREVTLDFARGGTVAKQANRIVAFINANIQGLSKFGREGFYGGTTKTEKVKFWGRMLIGVTLPSIVLYFINRKNKKYWEVPQWQRDLFWLIPYNNGNNFFRMPKPFEAGILMGSGVERALKFIEDKDEHAFNEFTDNFLRDFDPRANLPTAIKPIIENATNYNFFQRRKLESEKMENLLPQYRYTTFTTETAKGLGKLIGYSPIKIENLISGYTGGAGKLALDLLDLITGNKKKLPYTPETIPLLRGFLVREPVGSDSESINKFYDNYSKSEQAYNTLRELVKQGENIDKAKKDFPEYKYKKNYDKINTQLAELRKKVNLVLNSKTITPARKLELVRKYGALMTAVANKANKMFK